MMPKLKLLAFFILIASQGFAQDPQLSQYYNAPLFLNPALTGTAYNTRAVMNYRNQWTSLPSPYVTFAASFDHFIAPYKSGVGMLIKRDRQGDAGLTSTEADLIYSYHLDLSNEVTFIPAIQVGFVHRDLNFSNFIFGDQITSNGVSNLPTTDNFPKSGAPVSYLDISTGGMLYSEKFWIGYSGHHLNQPNEAFAGASKLPVKSSLHGGYKFFIEDPNQPGKYYRDGKEKSIIPTFMYKKQGLFDQLDLGAYTIYDPLMFGFWYRGIPIKHYKEGVNNNESLIFLIGVHYEGLVFGYSYDLTISRFRPGSGGSHEVSVQYVWEIPYKHYKKKKHPRKVSCPSFYK